jgi:hypothetical protein
MTPEQQACEHHFVTNKTQQTDGRYVLRLPVRGNPNQLGTSRRSAEHRLLVIERRLEKNPQHGDMCQFTQSCWSQHREDFTQKSGINRLNRVISLHTVQQQPQTTQSQQTTALLQGTMSHPTHNIWWHHSVITVNLVTSRFKFHNSSRGTTPHSSHQRGIHAALDVPQQGEGSQLHLLQEGYQLQGHQLHIMKQSTCFIPHSNGEGPGLLRHRRMSRELHSTAETSLQNYGNQP